MLFDFFKKNSVTIKNFYAFKFLYNTIEGGSSWESKNYFIKNGNNKYLYTIILLTK